MTSRVARSFLFMFATATLSSVMSPISAQVPPPGYPTTMSVNDSAGSDCTLGVVPDPVHPLGGILKMTNGRATQETISQREGFWTKTLASGGETTQKIFGAGTYLSACILGQWKAPIKVLPKAPAAPSTNSFTVRWADDASPSTWRYGVQYRIGEGDWRGWKSGTALRAAVFNGVNGKTYFFRARTIRVADKVTDWSPRRKVVT